jgi:hypothetical protein
LLPTDVSVVNKVFVFTESNEPLAGVSRTPLLSTDDVGDIFIKSLSNEAIVVPSCEPVECLSDVTVLKDEQKFNQDIPLSYKVIHEQRHSTNNKVVHVTSSKLNDLDRTYSNTSNNISSHIQTTDVHSNPVEQETHLDNMQSNTGKRLKMFFDAWTNKQRRIYGESELLLQAVIYVQVHGELVSRSGEHIFYFIQRVTCRVQQKIIRTCIIPENSPGK